MDQWAWCFGEVRCWPDLYLYQYEKALLALSAENSPPFLLAQFENHRSSRRTEPHLLVGHTLYNSSLGSSQRQLNVAKSSHGSTKAKRRGAASEVGIRRRRFKIVAMRQTKGLMTLEPRLALGERMIRIESFKMANSEPHFMQDSG